MNFAEFMIIFFVTTNAAFMFWRIWFDTKNYRMKEHYEHEIKILRANWEAQRGEAQYLRDKILSLQKQNEKAAQ